MRITSRGRAGPLRARPLLPDRARRPAAVVAACGGLVTLLLGLVTAGARQPDAVDQSVDSWIHARVAAHYPAMRALEAIANPVELGVLTVLIVLACLAVRRVNGAVLAVASLAAVAGITDWLLKPLFGRTLHGALSYPSGHVGSAFTLATVVVVLLLDVPGRVLRPAAKIAVAAVAALVGCAVAVGMIGLDYHYFTDTVGGATLGISLTLAAAFLLDLSLSRLPSNAHRGAPAPPLPPGRPSGRGPRERRAPCA
jgi:membrane-associated phospholipid phosphatase